MRDEVANRIAELRLELHNLRGRAQRLAENARFLRGQGAPRAAWHQVATFGLWNHARALAWELGRLQGWEVGQPYDLQAIRRYCAWIERVRREATETREDREDREDHRPPGRWDQKEWGPGPF